MPFSSTPRHHEGLVTSEADALINISAFMPSPVPYIHRRQRRALPAPTTFRSPPMKVTRPRCRYTTICVYYRRVLYHSAFHTGRRVRCYSRPATRRVEFDAVDIGHMHAASSIHAFLL